MRKKKENIAAQGRARRDDIPENDAMESEREQRFEEINGATSTEGVGPGFDTPEPDDLIENMQTSDGPVAGESISPPNEPIGLPGGKKRKGKAKRSRMRMVDRQRGNHIAARSARKI